MKEKKEARKKGVKHNRKCKDSWFRIFLPETAMYLVILVGHIMEDYVLWLKNTYKMISIPCNIEK